MEMSRGYYILEPAGLNAEVLEMAMFENEGHCRPSNEFFHLLIAMKDQNVALDLQERFGSRLGFAAYAEHECASARHCSFVEAIRNDPEFGKRLADLLAELIPTCRYPDIGRKILIHDVVTPYLAAGEEIFKTEDGYSFFMNGVGNIYQPLKEKGGKYILETQNEEYDYAEIMLAMARCDVINKEFIEAFAPKSRFLFVVDNNDGEGQIDIRIAKI